MGPAVTQLQAGWFYCCTPLHWGKKGGDYILALRLETPVCCSDLLLENLPILWSNRRESE